VAYGMMGETYEASASICVRAFATCPARIGTMSGTWRKCSPEAITRRRGRSEGPKGTNTGPRLRSSRDPRAPNSAMSKHSSRRSAPPGGAQRDAQPAKGFPGGPNVEEPELSESPRVVAVGCSPPVYAARRRGDRCPGIEGLPTTQLSGDRLVFAPRRRPSRAFDPTSSITGARRD
jgi:hypothetical protein